MRANAQAVDTLSFLSASNNPNPPPADSAWQTFRSQGSQAQPANPFGAVEVGCHYGHSRGSERAKPAGQSAYWCAKRGVA